MMEPMDGSIVPQAHEMRTNEMDAGREEGFCMGWWTTKKYVSAENLAINMTFISMKEVACL